MFKGKLLPTVLWIIKTEAQGTRAQQNIISLKSCSWGQTSEKMKIKVSRRRDLIKPLARTAHYPLQSVKLISWNLKIAKETDILGDFVLKSIWFLNKWLW